MVDAVVGAVIMVVATTSLLLAVEVTEDALMSARRYPLNPDELLLLDILAPSLRQQGRDTPFSRKAIEDVEVQVTEQLPRQYQ